MQWLDPLATIGFWAEQKPVFVSNTKLRLARDFYLNGTIMEAIGGADQVNVGPNGSCD